jgi:molecular chaperone DnaK
VVALGAAVQGGVFSGDVHDILLLDVTPLSLGIETLGGVMTKLIERNTTIPCQKSEVFSTAADNQGSVDVHVLQGEREFANDNRTLGNFRLDGLPPAPRGVPQIEVTFDIDANGIVNVSAKDKATGQEQSITITSDGSLSDEDIQGMVDQAKENEEADKLRLKVIENRNKLDTLVYQLRKMLDDHGDKLSEETTANLTEKLDAADGVMGGDDPEEIETVLKELEAALHTAGAEMYAKAAHAEGPPTDGPPPSTDEEVIDTEYQDAG